MLIYLVIGAFCIAAVYAAEKIVPPSSISAHVWARVMWALAFLSIFLLAALRFDIGTDYSSKSEYYLGYVEIFRVYTDGASMRYGIDASYLALIRFIGLFGGNAQWIFVITSALICALVMRACKRLSCSPVLSVALFLVAGLYLESYNIVRQWVAIACILNAFAWVGWSAEDGAQHPGGEAEQGTPLTTSSKALAVIVGTERGHVAGRSFARYAAWVLLAAFAHSSAIIWLFMWPLFSIKLNLKRVIVATIALVALAFAGWNILAVVLSGTRYARYFDNPTDLYTTAHVRWNALITTGCSLVFSLWCYRNREKTYGTYGRWASSLTMCLICLFALVIAETFLPYIVDRVARYLTPLLILQLPYALAQIDNQKLRRVFSWGVCLLWLAASCVQFVGGKDDVLPYQSILTTPQDEIEEMFNTFPDIPDNDRPLEEGAE